MNNGSKGVAHAADSHLFIRAYDIYPNNDMSQQGSPVYKCAHCKRYTIQNVEDADVRAHACGYQCDACTDGVLYYSPEVLIWHKYVHHQPTYASFLDKIRAVGPQVMKETPPPAAPVPVSEKKHSVSVRDIGRSYKHLEEAGINLNRLINETGIANDNAYLTCDLSKLHVKTLADAPSIPPAAFLAIASAVCTAMADRNNKPQPALSFDNDERDATLAACISAVLHPNCVILAENLDLKRLRDKVVKLVDIYKSTPALQNTRLVRYAVAIMNRILPFDRFKAAKRPFEAMHADATTIESPRNSPHETKRAKVDSLI